MDIKPTKYKARHAFIWIPLIHIFMDYLHYYCKKRPSPDGEGLGKSITVEEINR